MGLPVCTVCSSEKRLAIEDELDRGLSLRKVGARYGFTSSTLHRHRKCMGQRAMVAAQNVAVAADRPILGRLLQHVEDVDAELQAARHGRLYGAVANLAREKRMGLELIARVTRELDERPQVVNLLLDAGFIRALAIIREESPPDVFERIRDRLSLEAGNGNAG